MTDSTLAALALPPFMEFASIARLSRDMVVTEKIDGTNASVHIADDGRVLAGSRNRWITPDADNFGFARWVAEHADELRALGPGTHFGEWWGAGIQRRYGLSASGEKRFSLFNVGWWTSARNAEGATAFPDASLSTVCVEAPCCHVVPILTRDVFCTATVDVWLNMLATQGSYAAPGFMQPEGVVVYHAASKTLFKKTLDKNDGHKGGGK